MAYHREKRRPFILFFRHCLPYSPCDQSNLHGYWDSGAGLYCKSFTAENQDALLKALDDDLTALDADITANNWKDNLNFTVCNSVHCGASFDAVLRRRRSMVWVLGKGCG
jgi:hypothetical protein